MNLENFKEYILSFPDGYIFNYGISKPFSWRGSYDEVAFSIVETPMTRDEILANIELAYTEVFYGYKGGEFTYDDDTTVNFEEEGSRNYSNGGYVAKMIAQIENTKQYEDQEERLVYAAFK